MRRAIGLGDKEAAAQIGIEDQVPIVPGHIERRLAHIAAGIVDQDVDLAAGCLGIRCHALDARLFADIQAERGCLSAHRLNLGCERGQVLRACGW